MAVRNAEAIVAKKAMNQKHWAVTFNSPVDFVHHTGYDRTALEVGAAPGTYEITLVGPPVEVCKHQVSWWKGQLEKAPETGQEHIQMHVCFKSKVSFNGVKHWFDQSNFAGAHLEPVKDLSAHLAYVVKEESRLAGPYSSPGAPKDGEAVQGKRTDLEAVVQAAQGGATVETIWRDFPVVMVKHFRGMERLVQQIGTAPRRPEMITICFYGRPRTGKSTVMYKMAEELYPESPAFPKPIGKWFCGYHGQEVIVLDDFDSKGQACREIKNLCDKTPCIVETKGGQVHLRNKMVLITCNKDPRTWFPHEDPLDLEAVLERCLFFRVDELLVDNAGMAEGFALNAAGEALCREVRAAIMRETIHGESSSGKRGISALVAQADRYVPYRDQIIVAPITPVVVAGNAVQPAPNGRVQRPRAEVIDEGAMMVIESDNDEIVINSSEDEAPAKAKKRART